MKQLFNTETKIKSAIDSFTNLLSHPGWKLVKEIIEINIEVVRVQLEEGREGETKEDVDRLREKLRIYREIINTPDTMLIRLQSSDAVELSIDPFYTANEIKEERVKKEENKA